MWVKCVIEFCSYETCSSNTKHGRKRTHIGEAWNIGHSDLLLGYWRGASPGACPSLPLMRADEMFWRPNITYLFSCPCLHLKPSRQEQRPLKEVVEVQRTPQKAGHFGNDPGQPCFSFPLTGFFMAGLPKKQPSCDLSHGWVSVIWSIMRIIIIMI